MIILLVNDRLVKVPELQETMKNMAMEMERVRAVLLNPCRAVLTHTTCSSYAPMLVLMCCDGGTQAGCIGEMMDDAMDSTMEGVEEAADEEIEKVVAEVTQGQFGSLRAAPIGSIAAVSHCLSCFLVTVLCVFPAVMAVGLLL